MKKFLFVISTEIAFLFFLFLFHSAEIHAQQINVKSFSGNTLATVLANAQGACQTGIPCVLYIPPEMGSFPKGTIVCTSLPLLLDPANNTGCAFSSGTSGNIFVNIPGNFTTSTSRMNESIQSLINNCNPLTEFQKGVSNQNATEAITGCIIVPPSGNSAFQVNAISGYVDDNSNGGVPNVVAGSFIGYCSGTGSHCWGINPVGSEIGSASNGIIQAIEADFGSNSPGSTAFGAQITYSPSCTQGGCATNSYGIRFNASNLARPMTYGINWSQGCCTTGMQLSQTGTANSVGSMSNCFAGRNAGGVTQNTCLAADLNGNLILSPQPTATSFFQSNGISTNRIQQGASNQLAGTCVFAAATTCSITFANTFTNPPDVFLQPINPGAVTFTLNSAPTTTGFTITASASNSLTVHWLSVGNPN